MTQLETKVEKWVTRRDTGILTDTEIIDTFLVEAANAKNDREVLAAIRLLPDDLLQALGVRFEKLASDNYHFRPPMIGSGLTEEEAARLAERIRSLHGELSDYF